VLLYVGKILVAIPTFTTGKLTLAPKNKDGQPLKSKVGEQCSKPVAGRTFKERIRISGRTATRTTWTQRPS
jgi:hypothetical protein